MPQAQLVTLLLRKGHASSQARGIGCEPLQMGLGGGVGRKELQYGGGSSDGGGLHRGEEVVLD